MTSPSSASSTPSPGRLLLLAGWLFLGAGLLAHLYAAHAGGGSGTAYFHHVFGFFFILVVTGGVIAGLGWRFWKSRVGLAVLVIGVVQALIGLWVALEPMRR